MPTHLLLLCLPGRVDQRSHPLVVVTIRLHEVYDVKTIGAVGSCVADFEEEPLSVAVCTVVIFKVQIVLIV